MPAAAIAVCRALGSDEDADRRGPPHLSRPAAPHGAHPREGRRPLRQRQQGDQPDRDRARARRVPSASAGSAAGRPRPTISTNARRISAMSRTAYTIGEAGELFASALVAAHGRDKLWKHLDDAVRTRPRGCARPGIRCLLSPACASFDQFRDFEERGDQFRELGGGVMIGSISGKIKAKAALDRSRPLRPLGHLARWAAGSGRSTRSCCCWSAC